MSSLIPKIKVGVEKHKRAKLDLGFDSNTTSSVGFVQPIGLLDLVPDSHTSLRVKNAVRLAPVAAPTFGRFMNKTYAYYIPKRDLYMPYDEFVSGTAYAGSNGTYVPTYLPFISQELITALCLRSSSVKCYVTDIISSGHYVNYDSVASNQDSIAYYKDFLHVVVPYFSQDNLSSLVPDFVAGTASQFVPDIDSADFVLHLGSAFSPTNKNLVFCFKFTRFGKNLRQILLGLGYQLGFPGFTGTKSGFNSTNLSALPLFAYFKAWFNLFEVKRSTPWGTTNCAKLITRIANNNSYDLTGSSTASDVSVFFRDLTTCYYNCDPDFYTAHIVHPAESFSSTSFSSNAPATLAEQNLSVNQNAQPAISTSTANPVLNRVLERVLRYVNKNTTLGQRVSAYMKAHGLGAPDDNKNANFIGSYILNIDVDPVMSMADTADAALGDYAGQGYSQGSSDNWQFDNKEAGYIILLSAIVPRSGYCQGISPTLFNLRKLEQYHPEFDAMAYEVTDSLAFVGSEDVCVNHSDFPAIKSQGFGFIPTMSSYKTHANIANGDLTLRSTRKDMLPYFLDRYFTPHDTEDVSTVTNPHRVKFVPGTIPTVYSDSLRSIGKVEGMGNFDRIFTNVEETDSRVSTYKVPLVDNFIVNNIIDCAVFAPVIPLSESFDTDHESAEINVEKA